MSLITFIPSDVGSDVFTHVERFIPIGGAFLALGIFFRQYVWQTAAARDVLHDVQADNERLRADNARYAALYGPLPPPPPRV